MKRNSIYFRDPHIQKMIFDPTLIPLLPPSYKNGQKMVKRPEFLQLYKNGQNFTHRQTIVEILPPHKNVEKFYPQSKKIHPLYQKLHF